MRNIVLKDKLRKYEAKPKKIAETINKIASPVKPTYFVAISTYNREVMVKSLVDNLVADDRITVINVIDDDSEAKFEYVSDKVNVVLHGSNYGKKGYWRTVNEHIAEYRKSGCTHFLQLDDDFILDADFIDRLDHFVKANVSSIVKIHIDGRHGRPMWGFAKWVDGGACYPRQFISKIGWRVPSIPASRWRKDQLLSSGVWQEMTRLINEHGWKVASPAKSMVTHGGSESKMNPEARKKTPIQSIK